MLHRFAIFVAASTVVLLLAGSLVTSTGSGLAVPDWPTTYGENMFTFPPSKWVGGIFYEHGHRLIASTVGFLTIILATWLWRAEPRRWLKRLGAAALGAVILQGILGGVTVLFFLPAAISTAHAGLAEIFFCMTVAIALFTSPGWIQGVPPTDDATLRRVATATTAVIYLQILVGAVMRHTEAGLAIPDFPLMFGGLVPDHWDRAIAVHFAHRVGALVVTAFVVATCLRIWSPRRRAAGESIPRSLSRPAMLIAGLVVVQISLGGLTVLTERAVWVNSLHVVCGALVLATSVVISLRSWRGRFAHSAEPGEADAFLQAGSGSDSGGGVEPSPRGAHSAPARERRGVQGAPQATEPAPSPRVRRPPELVDRRRGRGAEPHYV
jgi:cytochrome c oxidase assembly protein subunit 15